MNAMVKFSELSHAALVPASASPGGAPVANRSDVVWALQTGKALASAAQWEDWSDRVRSSYETPWSRKAAIAFSGIREVLGPSPMFSACYVAAAIAMSYALHFLL